MMRLWALPGRRVRALAASKQCRSAPGPPCSVATHLRDAKAYHVARKQIPSVAGPVPGIKLELFIFDTFPLAERTLLMEVCDLCFVSS